TIHPAQANVQEVLFAKYPGVTFEVPAEDQFDSAGSGRRCVDRAKFKFGFLSDDKSGRTIFLRYVSRNRAEMPARTDQHFCLNLTIDQPIILLLLDAFHLHAFAHSRPTSSEQISVEFATPYSVADGFVKRYRKRLLFHTGDLKRGNRLKDPSTLVV